MTTEDFWSYIETYSIFNRQWKIINP